MIRPLVSVCMPCYNAEQYLSMALDSVLAQTYRSIEIVAADDGSSDNTLSILKRYQTSSGIRVVTNQREGAAAARNLALSHSQGALIKFMDADDIISSDLIQLQVERLAGQSDCIASAEWGRFADDISKASFRPDGTWVDRTGVNWLLEAFRDGGRHAMMQCGMFLIPRPILDAAGQWDERLSLIDDLDFFSRIVIQSRQVLMTSGKLYYRSGLPISLSGQKTRKAYESAVLAVEKFADTLMAYEDSQRTRKVCADLIQNLYFELAPHHRDLGKCLEVRVQELGGSNVKPMGGPAFQLLSHIVGWKVATRMRKFGYSRGYARFRSRFGRK